ncbi:uncharacterized protein LOC132295384 [Cornus florida]|uniref:uncharacterized protein LOC132295384 n=1 Tax=Cornus florida TaxID=4283 RepID=UPI00289C1414|nr:uncharacterized protein LOC132295384 [Cornus florida]
MGYEEIWCSRVLDKTVTLDTLPDGRSPRCLDQPPSYQKDGAVLIFDYSRSGLIYYDPKGPKFRYFKIKGVNSKFEAIAYIPSFISLKDAIVGDDAKVLNINSRCAKFKMPGETRTLSLVEEYKDKPLDSNCSS